jgi:IPT/TIG domain
MRRLPLLTLSFLTAAIAIAPIAPADAATRSKGPKPTITRVTPMRVTVGETLTIRGKGFKAKAGANTVVFQGAGGRSAFVKPRRATSRKLVVRITASVARLLAVRDSRQVPTRMRLRVLAGRFSSFTPRRLSPVVLSLTYGGPGNPDKPAPQTVDICKSDADHDDDLLSNAVELQYGTDPCLKDTDRDGTLDGWEFYAAKDLNIKAVPYPGNRPFPNPLDPTDAKLDFDGDGLSASEEFRAWVVTGSSFLPEKVGGTDLESPLGYSDGTKFSRAGETPTAPAWRGPLYGLAAPAQPFPATFDMHNDAPWHDDERDADGDGLANWLEADSGPKGPEYQKGYWAQEAFAVPDWPQVKETCPQPAGFYGLRPFAKLDLADRDVDGDDLLDGEDDQDNDDLSNIVELYEIVSDLDGDGQASCVPGAASMTFGGESRLVNAFNPCAPNPASRTCPDYVPF